METISHQPYSMPVPRHALHVCQLLPSFASSSVRDENKDEDEKLKNIPEDYFFVKVSTCPGDLVDLSSPDHRYIARYILV